MLRTMSAAIAYRRLLVCTAFALYGVIFAAFMLFEKPGLGIGHFYYVAVALLAVTGGIRFGLAAGVGATALYVIGVVANPHIPPTEVLTVSTAIRLATFATSGALIGWFAENNRELVAQLQVLAERDQLTGLPNTRAFEKAITERLDSDSPFALLVGETDALDPLLAGDVAADDALRELADRLRGMLEPVDEIARVGGNAFAILSSQASGEGASRLAGRLETALAGEGRQITFGWAVAPREGTNALSLYRAADERLYARKLMRRGSRVVALPGAAS